jgi:F-type H+-transporting ATPase subunit b
MLEINPTVVFIQIANFLVLLFLLNIFVYRPIRRILIQRKAQMDHLEGQIGDYQSRCEQREKGIEDGMIQARQEGLSERENFKGKALEEEKGILHRASAALDEKIGSAKRDTETRIGEVRKALELQVLDLSQELVSKILGRTIR